MSEFKVAHIGTQPLTTENCCRLVAGMGREKTSILPVTTAGIAKSYAEGMSSVMIEKKTGNAIAHIRFSPLITPQLREQLQLPPGLPMLWEIGSGYVVKEHRKEGLYNILRNEHVGRFKEELTTGSHIFLGTTKSIRVLHALRHAQEEHRIEGVILPHTSLPFIAAFTCVCKGDFGQGYQCGVNACKERIQPGQFPMMSSENGLLNQTNISAIDEIKDLNGGEGKIPCTMYVQGEKNTILNMEQQLADKFGTPENLVDRLRQVNVNYYNEPLVSLLLTNLRQFMKKGVSGLNSFNLQGR